MILKIVIILITTFFQLAVNLNIAGECIFSEFIGSVPAKGINKWCESNQKINLTGRNDKSQWLRCAKCKF